MKTIKCKALVAFTQYVPGFGQVHGNPDAKDKAAKFPMVPLCAVALLVEYGRIEEPNGFVDPVITADEGFGDAAVEPVANDAPAV